MVIVGYHCLYTVIHGYRWLNTVLHGYTMDMDGYGWLYMVIVGNRWLYTVIHGYCWLTSYGKMFELLEMDLLNQSYG